MQTDSFTPPAPLVRRQSAEAFVVDRMSPWMERHQPRLLETARKVDAFAAETYVISPLGLFEAITGMKLPSLRVDSSVIE